MKKLETKKRYVLPGDFITTAPLRLHGNVVLDGKGSIETYTIMTVPPTGFEKYAPYAWVVMSIDNANLRISGFLPNVAKPEDLPIGTKAKVSGFDDRGIILEKL